MAGDLGRRLATTVPDDDDTGKALVGSGFGPWPPYPGYWQCKSAVAQTCGGWDSWKNKGNCFGCARGNMNPGRRGSSSLSGCTAASQHAAASAGNFQMQQSCTMSLPPTMMPGR